MTASLSRLQAYYQEATPEKLLRAMIHTEFKGKIAALTSFGADSAILLSLIAEIDPDTPVFFLDTQKHFPETLSYACKLKKFLGLRNVVWLQPNEEMLNRIDTDGNLWKHQPNRCCWLRKVEPLDRAIAEKGIEALITGRKRFQTVQRAAMEPIELDEKGIFRINPLAAWTRAQMDFYSIARQLPTHPLVEHGYKSIGCAPCTHPVRDGQDERAGRWAHTFDGDDKKTECGIHVPTEAMSWSV